MKYIINSSRKWISILAIVSTTSAFAQDAHHAPVASVPVLSEVSNVPCATLQEFEGEVQLMNPDRTELIPTSLNAPIPCDGWVSVKFGWAKIKHNYLNYTIQAGQETFLKVIDFQNAAIASANHDQVLLFKGRVYIEGDLSAGMMKVVSANARARVRNGGALITFDQSEDETQLVSFAEKSSLENRFETSRVIDLKPGESTALNFKAVRVIPDMPSAVKMADLKAGLIELHLKDAQKIAIVDSVKKRQARQFASPLNPSSDRRPASMKALETKSYQRNHLQPDDEKIQGQWVRHLVGDETSGEKILFPDQYQGRSQDARIVIADPASKMKKKRTTEEEAEMNRLVEELTQLRTMQ